MRLNYWRVIRLTTLLKWCLHNFLPLAMLRSVLYTGRLQCASEHRTAADAWLKTGSLFEGGRLLLMSLTEAAAAEAAAEECFSIIYRSCWATLDLDERVAATMLQL